MFKIPSDILPGEIHYAANGSRSLITGSSRIFFNLPARPPRTLACFRSGTDPARSVKVPQIVTRGNRVGPAELCSPGQSVSGHRHDNGERCGFSAPACPKDETQAFWAACDALAGGEGS